MLEREALSFFSFFFFSLVYLILAHDLVPSVPHVAGRDSYFPYQAGQAEDEEVARLAKSNRKTRTKLGTFILVQTILPSCNHYAIVTRVITANGSRVRCSQSPRGQSPNSTVSGRLSQADSDSAAVPCDTGMVRDSTPLPTVELRETEGEVYQGIGGGSYPPTAEHSSSSSLARQSAHRIPST